jgi:hypothetical protein
MFPIPANQPLTFAKVADFWSRDVTPRASRNELLNELVKAWWRGDLVASGAKRSDVLRAIYNFRPDLVSFAFPEAPDPKQENELPNGSIEMLWLWRIPLPNSQPETWVDDNCVEAFQAVAEAWDGHPELFELCFPVLRALELTEPEFSRWIGSQGKPTLTFWSRADERPDARIPRPSLTQQRAISIALDFIQSETREGRRPTQREFESKIRADNFVADRELIIRPAFKEAARRSGIDVRRGRYPKTRAKIAEN